MYAFIDGKFFQVYLNGAERARAAQHSTYGAYRQPGKGRLSTGYVKPKAGSLRQNSGVKGVLLHMGIGGGGVVTVREAKADGMARLAAKRATIVILESASSPSWRTKRPNRLQVLQEQAGEK